MVDYLGFVRSESALFNQAVAAVEASGATALAETPVPSCSGWNAADLTWHLAEVQYFWASIVEGNLTSYSQVVPLQRPADDELVSLQNEQGTRLASLLEGHDSQEPCWSWHPRGHTVGWVLRRQAHESLIHRVDAELTAEAASAGRRTEIDEMLATDGVDEILTVMLDATDPPEGTRFESSGRTARLISPQTSWDLTLGRVIGTAGDGTSTDLPALNLALPVMTPTVEIQATGADLDLWLWRREDLPVESITGDPTVADELHELAAIE